MHVEACDIYCDLIFDGFTNNKETWKHDISEPQPGRMTNVKWCVEYMLSEGRI